MNEISVLKASWDGESFLRKDKLSDKIANYWVRCKTSNNNVCLSVRKR